MTATIFSMKILLAVIAPDSMEENVVKSFCGGSLLDVKIGRDEKFSVGIWHIVKFCFEI